MAPAIKDEVEQALPLIRKGEVALATIETLTQKLRHAMKEDPTQGKELGPLLAQISAASKVQATKPLVNWVAVDKGWLAIGHKPGGKVPLDGLKQAGGTAVLTLLQENEGAALIGQQAKKAGLQWIWFPFSASRPHQGDQVFNVVGLFTILQQLLGTGHKIYIHCSAGIHRTGMITYGLLRFLGKEKGEALSLLQSLREVTAAQVGEDRLVWGDQFAAAAEKAKEANR
jgi:hypothetical protein